MTKNVQKISLLAIIPIIAVAMTFVPLIDVHAQKICGDRLCVSGNAEDERKKMRDSFISSPTEPAKIIDVAESEKQIDPGSLLR
jgi:hypothetical protein